MKHILKDEKVTHLKQHSLWMQDKANSLEQEIMSGRDRMVILECDMLLNDTQLLSKTKIITGLEGRSMQEVKLNGFEDDSVIGWLVNNCNAIALRQHSRKEANYSS